MAKRSYTKIAEHFGTDEESVRECEYQPGRFSKAIFAIGDEYWCAVSEPARYNRRIFSRFGWIQIISAYDHKTILWRYSSMLASN
jgi:hypothetical protein